MGWVPEGKRDEVSGMQVHPVADMLPLMQGEEFDALVADIKLHGRNVVPIVMFKGVLIDGRNRARACVAAGVRPEETTYKGPDTPEALIRWIVSQNVHRRHLDTSQRAMLAARIAKLGHGGKRRGQERNSALETVFEAAASLNVSKDSVKDARVVIERGAPEVVEAVDRGEVAVSKAAADIRRAEKPPVPAMPPEPEPDPFAIDDADIPPEIDDEPPPRASRSLRGGSPEHAADRSCHTSRQV
jgi:hypothetical protein